MTLKVPAVALAFLAAACGSSSSSSSTTPTALPVKPTLVATLSPANEVPPITNAESTGNGAVSVLFDTTTDSSGNITSAKATFTVTLNGFPANTPINIAHIHQGASTCVCPVVVNTTLASGTVVLSNGSGTFVKTDIVVDPAVAQGILNNASNYYFNVHSTLNPGGAARGTLTRVQ